MNTSPEEILEIANGIVYQYVGAQVYEIKRKIKALQRKMNKQRLQRPNNEDEDTFPKFES